jgi:hypothetical protein
MTYLFFRYKNVFATLKIEIFEFFRDDATLKLIVYNLSHDYQ